MGIVGEEKEMDDELAIEGIVIRVFFKGMIWRKETREEEKRN